MFNFNVMNRALTDSNLTDKEFRMLYAIINNCSLKNSNSVEIYNAQLMLILNISERWIRNLTNQLVSKGYISKEVKGTSKNKQANIYTLLEVEGNDTSTNSLCHKSDTQKFPLTDDVTNNIINDIKMIHESDTQKFPLKNNIKINKNNIYNNIDLIPEDDIEIKEKNNKKENTNNDRDNNFNDDVNNSGTLSIEEEKELDQLINSIPSIKEIRSMNKQENITNNPTIEESDNNVNPTSIVLTFPVNISGKKQEINLNVECNDINTLTPQEKFLIRANLNYQISIFIPEVMIDGYWTKDCYSSIPSPYEFEHVLLPEAIKRYNLIQDQLIGNSSPAPAENAQGCVVIASNVENGKEYHPTQENKTGAKTEANNDNQINNCKDEINETPKNVEKRSLTAPNKSNDDLYQEANKKLLEELKTHNKVDELISDISNRLRREEKEDIYNIDMYDVFKELQIYLINNSDKNIKDYGFKRMEKVIDNINNRTLLFESQLEIILNSTRNLLYKNLVA